MLNDINKIKQIDKSNMLNLIFELPENCEEAVKIAYKCIKGHRYHNIFNVVVTGMGGSAIGGDLIRMLTLNEVNVPITINRDYSLPQFVDDKTLVVASSYSGNTEETLAAYDEAVRRKAKILAITSGGQLKKKAMEDEIPLITIPGGLPPRAALGYSFFPMLIAMQEQGIISQKHFNSDEVIQFLKETRNCFKPEIPVEDNPAKALAEKLYKKLPIIYGISGINDIVAARWKAQINENAKHPAFCNAFPELDHNEIMGYEGDKDLLSFMEIILLRSSLESDRIKKRIDITIDILKEKVGGITQIWAKGNTPLEMMFYHIMFADYVSAYLAVLNEKDPIEIKSIDKLKSELK